MTCSNNNGNRRSSRNQPESNNGSHNQRSNESDSETIVNNEQDTEPELMRLFRSMVVPPPFGPERRGRLDQHQPVQRAMTREEQNQHARQILDEALAIIQEPLGQDFFPRNNIRNQRRRRGRHPGRPNNDFDHPPPSQQKQ